MPTASSGRAGSTTARTSSAPIARQKKPPDRWYQSDVWVKGEHDEPWKAAVCLGHTALSTGDEPVTWRFNVELKKGERIDVATRAMDTSCAEFEYIKLRDDAMDASSMNDMTYLAYLNEPEMMECLRRRYCHNKIYTNIGPILVAINPFQSLPLYTEEVLIRFINADMTDAAKLGPHVYQVAGRAYSEMLIDKFDPDSRENQSILVSGESGAGKTESTKHILHFLAVLSCQIADRLGVTCNGSDFESLITAAIPITESFGNATTSRNNNSSRFAKFIELLYTADGYVDGAVINTYLLESVRVIRQGSGERNFHVFYEIFAGLSEEQRVEWSFLSLEDFAYTNQSGEYTRHDDISDFDNFVRLKNAMTKMNLSEFEQEDIFKVLIAVLHIGNICFREWETTGDEGAIFSDTSSDHVRCVCAFTGIEEEDLLRAMTKRTIIVAGSEVHKSLNVTAAGVARDAVAQYLYGLIFDSMIKNVNVNVLMNDSSAVASFIGVLDISGFEHFKHNSFEQLCINYTNEKLQDYFNFSVFVSEREVYEREGLHWRCDTYPDNSGMLELFEHKINSIFSLCDELLKVPRPTDDQLFSALVAKCSVNKFFETSKSSRGKGVFTVHHFAVSVQYDSEGFLSKNRNEVAGDIVACFAASMRPIMDKMRGEHCHRSALLRRAHSSFQSAPTKSIAVVSKKTATMASQLRKNLQNLMDKIRLTRSHFIRCVKPNSALSSNSFDYMMAMKQIRCGGALDTLQVFRTGFSNRMEMQFFVTRYALFLTSCGFNALTRRFVDFLKLSRQTGSGRHWKSAALYLIDMLPVTSLIINWLYYGEHDRAQGIALTKDVVHHGLQVGRGQIFCRAHIHESLEVMRRMALDNVAQNLQRRRRARLLISDAHNGRHTALLATQAIIYFSDFRIRKARKHVCAIFIIQRQWRVHVAVCARRLFQRSVARIRCAVRRFLAKIKATRQLRLRDIRRSIATRSVQCAWKAYLNRPVKIEDAQLPVSEVKDIPVEDSLRDANSRISLLLQDIDSLKISNAFLLEENADLKERIETLTAVDRNFTSNETVTASATNIPFHSEQESGEIMDSSAKLGQIMMHRGSMRESAGSPLSVAVTEYMRLRSSEVVFLIVVKLKTCEWNAVRTYSDFCSLRKKLKNCIEEEVDALFPPVVFYFLKLSDEEAESRRCWLDQYLTRVSQSLYINTSAGAFQLLMDFFGADEIGIEEKMQSKLSVFSCGNFK